MQPPRSGTRPRWFWAIGLVVLLTDCTTKRIASEHLIPHVPQPVVDDVLRFTLIHNPGAALGLNFGEYSRVGFSLLAAAMLIVMARLYRDNRTEPRIAIAVALIAGGAAGNLLDRLRSPLGVVDFIDIGIGAHRFWIFNVADMGVMIGAAALAIHLWRSDGAEEPRREPIASDPPRTP
jgi:signal peptidase II